MKIDLTLTPSALPPSALLAAPAIDGGGDGFAALLVGPGPAAPIPPRAFGFSEFGLFGRPGRAPEGPSPAPPPATTDPASDVDQPATAPASRKSPEESWRRPAAEPAPATLTAPAPAPSQGWTPPQVDAPPPEIAVDSLPSATAAPALRAVEGAALVQAAIPPASTAGTSRTDAAAQPVPVEAGANPARPVPTAIAPRNAGPARADAGRAAASESRRPQDARQQQAAGPPVSAAKAGSETTLVLHETDGVLKIIAAAPGLAPVDITRLHRLTAAVGAEFGVSVAEVYVNGRTTDLPRNRIMEASRGARTR